MKKEYERIEREEQELRGHLENAKKLRMYLNKHLEGTLRGNQQGGGYASKKSSVPAPDNFWNGW